MEPHFVMTKPQSLDAQLVESAQKGDAGNVALLIKKGANAKHAKSEALRTAAKQGHLDVVKLLAPESDPCANGSEAYHSARLEGHADVASYLHPLSELAPCKVSYAK